MAEEVARLDQYLDEIAIIMRRKDATPAIKLKAMDRRLRIQERRSRLLGLEQPAKLEHSGSIGMDPKVETLAIIDELLPAGVTQPDAS